MSGVDYTSVMIVGDVHGQFDALDALIENRCIDEEQNDNALTAVIVCGDYGIWNDFTVDNVPERYRLKSKIPVYFVDGNHDNHTELDKYERGKIHNVIGNLYYCAYGSVIELPQGYKVLCCGGALSIDRYLRKPGVSWWPTECISEEDQSFLPDPNSVNIDIVVSHTAPTEVCKRICSNDISILSCSSSKLSDDPSPKFLDAVLERYKPIDWFFGHWHTYFEYAYNHGTTKYDNTYFTGLNMLPFINNRSYPLSKTDIERKLLLKKHPNELRANRLTYYKMLYFD